MIRINLSTRRKTIDTIRIRGYYYDLEINVKDPTFKESYERDRGRFRKYVNDSIKESIGKYEGNSMLELAVRDWFEEVKESGRRIIVQTKELYQRFLEYVKEN